MQKPPGDMIFFLSLQVQVSGEMETREDRGHHLAFGGGGSRDLRNFCIQRNGTMESVISAASALRVIKTKGRSLLGRLRQREASGHSSCVGLFGRPLPLVSL